MRESSGWEGYSLSETLIGLSIILILTGSIFAVVMTTQGNLARRQQEVRDIESVRLASRRIAGILDNLDTGYWMAAPDIHLSDDGRYLSIGEAEITFAPESISIDAPEGLQVFPLKTPCTVELLILPAVPYPVGVHLSFAFSTAVDYRLLVHDFPLAAVQ